MSKLLKLLSLEAISARLHASINRLETADTEMLSNVGTYLQKSLTRSKFPTVQIANSPLVIDPIYSIAKDAKLIIGENDYIIFIFEG